MSKSKFNALSNSKGQGMIEYMILVALIAVGTTAAVKLLGQNVAKQYENINRAIGGKAQGKLSLDSMTESQLNLKDLSNFMEGSRTSPSSKK